MKKFTVYSSYFDLDIIAEAFLKVFDKSNVELKENKQNVLVNYIEGTRETEITFNIVTSITKELDFYNMKKGMHNFFQQIPAKNEDIKNKLLLKIDALKTAIGVVCEVDISEEVYNKILAVVKALDGIVLRDDGALLDFSGKLILNTEGISEVEDFVITNNRTLFGEEIIIRHDAVKRKEKNERFLMELDFPVNTDLPVIVGEEDAKIRSKKEIAKRAIALCLVGVKAEGILRGERKEKVRELVAQIIEQYDALDYLSPQELEFINKESPSKEDCIQFAWRYEAYWVLLWALKHVKRLEIPNKTCDISKAVYILSRMKSLGDFLSNSQLRYAREILDEADLIYRYDWVCVEARLKGLEVPGNINSDVVTERHKALNWLISYLNQDWDEVRTDT
ncbi:MAG: DUF4272 domain-containing protein [Bacillota bacterium]|nr:DUF4272 domain-containing protein [Bacillota bacterium]